MAASDKPTTLVEKLAAIYGEIKAFDKEGKNAAQGYAFIAIEQVVQYVRPLLAKHGVIIMPEGMDVQWDEGTRQNGSAYTICHLTVTWRITDGETDLYITSVGEAHDSGDKAGNKAQTAAWKQALTKLFFIAADEDNDANASLEDRMPQQRQAPRPAPPKQQQGGRRPPPTEDQGYGICPQHGYAWFQRGQMKQPAHPNEDGSWCNKAQVEEAQAQ